MEGGSKLGAPPPLVAAFCLCALFFVMHFMSSPAVPSGFGSNAGPVQQLRVPRTSFLAVQNGVAVKYDSEQHQAKQEVKQEQKLLKQEEALEKKEKSHIKSEEANLKKEKKLLEQERAASSRGDAAAFQKLDKKLDKLTQAETRDASIAHKVQADELKHSARLDTLFNKWATSVQHPGSKWKGKHEKVSNQQHKIDHRLAVLASRQSKAEKAQSAFVEQRRTFVQGKPQVEQL